VNDASATTSLFVLSGLRVQNATASLLRLMMTFGAPAKPSVVRARGGDRAGSARRVATRVVFLRAALAAYGEAEHLEGVKRTALQGLRRATD
jgi:hypothetical protein